MLEQLEGLQAQALELIQTAGSVEELNGVRQSVMGKKGSLTGILKELGKLSPEERKTVGQAANVVKAAIADALTAREEALIAQGSALDYDLDLTLPGIAPVLGGLHPITQMAYDLNDAFRSLGFAVYEEVEITSEKFAFDHLNFPPSHPARESMDTFWLAGTEDKEAEERLCLRPHLTGGSVRYLREHGALPGSSTPAASTAMKILMPATSALSSSMKPSSSTAISLLPPANSWSRRFWKKSSVRPWRCACAPASSPSSSPGSRSI